MKTYKYFVSFMFLIGLCFLSNNSYAKTTCTYYPKTKIKKVCNETYHLKDFGFDVKKTSYYSKNSKKKYKEYYKMYEDGKLISKGTKSKFKMVKKQWKPLNTYVVNYYKSGKIEGKSTTKLYNNGKYKYRMWSEYQNNKLGSKKEWYYHKKKEKRKKEVYKEYAHKRKRNRLYIKFVTKYPLTKKKGNKTRKIYYYNNKGKRYLRYNAKWNKKKTKFIYEKWANKKAVTKILKEVGNNYVPNNDLDQ